MENTVQKTQSGHTILKTYSGKHSLENTVYKTHSEITQGKFKYFSTLTKEWWPHEGRITNWLFEQRIEKYLELPKYDYTQDRMMICGSQGLNTDIMNWLESQGAQEGNTSTPGDFLIEKAFVQR